MIELYLAVAVLVPALFLVFIEVRQHRFSLSALRLLASSCYYFYIMHCLHFL
jgi:hypothetical protein